MQNDVKIVVRDLNLFIGKQHILKNINVDIPKNKITVIMGPSGCGKTTLLKSLNRLTDLYPEMKVSGSILIDGEDVFHPDLDITRIRQSPCLSASNSIFAWHADWPLTPRSSLPMSLLPPSIPFPARPSSKNSSNSKKSIPS